MWGGLPHTVWLAGGMILMLQRFGDWTLCLMKVSSLRRCSIEVIVFAGWTVCGSLSYKHDTANLTLSLLTGLTTEWSCFNVSVRFLSQFNVSRCFCVSKY